MKTEDCKLKETCKGSNFCWDGTCCLKTVFDNLTAQAPISTYTNYRNILKAFALGRNIFLTAPGGFGKSHLLNQLREALPNKITVTATTGIAALGVGGATLHSTLGLGLGKKSVKSLLSNLNSYKLDFLNRLEILAIDEVSMLSGELLDKCNEFLKLARMDNRPFGGVQVILIGDFCQLPPIDTESTVKDYCFYSKTWQELKLACFELNYNFRQKDDTEYANILANLRVGRITQNGFNFIKSRTLDPPKDVPRLYATNAEVRQYNYDKLVELGTEIKTFNATYRTDIDGIKRNKDYFNSLVDKMKKSSISEDVLELAEEARVMLIRNLDIENGLVNGSLGYIDCFCEDGSILVKFDNGEERWVKKVDMDMVDCEGKVLITQTQYPLKLASSISVHKCVEKSSLVYCNNLCYNKIEDIKEGDFVMTGFGDAKKILNKSSKQLKTGYRITTHCGYELICSEDHPLLINDGNGEYFKELKNIKSTDYICIDRTILSDNEDYHFTIPEKGEKDLLDLNYPKIMNEEFSWFLGYLVGNGCYNDAKRDGRLEVTTPDLRFANLINNILKNIGLNVKIREKQGKSVCYQLYIHSVGFYRFLLANGLNYAKAETKRIPECIFKSNSRCRASFLRGLFDADGSMSNKKIRYVSKSHKLIKDIKMLLLNFGIITYELPSTKGSLCLHVLSTSVNNYYKYIGFLSKEKQFLLEKYLENYKDKTELDIIPDGKLLAKNSKILVELELGRGVTRKVRYKYNPNANKTKHVFYGNFNYNYSHIKYIYELLKLNQVEIPKDLDSRIRNNFFYDRIEKIEKLSTPVEMYDLEVDETHSFVANGFVSHNCQGCTLDKVFIDFDRFFEVNQAYVALSRVKSSQGLYVKNFKLSALKFAPQVLQFYGVSL